MAKVPGTEETLELLVHSKTYPRRAGTSSRRYRPAALERRRRFCQAAPSPASVRRHESGNPPLELDPRPGVPRRRGQSPRKLAVGPAGGGPAIQPFPALDVWRWDWMKKTVHESSTAMDAKGHSSGCVQIEPLDFYWEPDEKEWTPSQMSVIRQESFFRLWQEPPPLPDRVPWQFRLRYREKSNGIEFDGRVLALDLYEGFRRERKTAASDEFALLAIAKECGSGYSILRGRSSRSWGTMPRLETG